MFRHLVLKVCCFLIVASTLSPSFAKTFRYPESSKPTSLMPFFAENTSAVRISEFLFEGLVAKNKRGDIEGVLAQSWNTSPNGMSITFQLRPNVQWHDGRPFTAADVVFTVQAAQDRKTIFNAKSKFRFIRSVQPLGSHQVKFIFNQPRPKAEQAFTFKIIPKHAFKSTVISRTSRFNIKPIGTGPYKVVKKSPRTIRLSKFANYWGKTKIDVVEMQHTPEANEQLNLLKYSGQGSGIQAMIFIPPKNMSQFENSDSVVLEPFHTVSWWYLAFNHKNPSLQDLNVRKAIALALNREELLEAHLGHGDILSGPFTESSPYYNFDVELMEQDIEEAKSLLDRAGYKMKRGVRTKGKKKLKFKFVLSKDLPNSQQLALSIQAQLKQIGIIVQQVFADTSLYQEKIFNKKKFDLTMNIWSFNEIEDVYPLFKTGQVPNFISYSNPDVDTKLDQSRRTKDYKVRKEIMKDLHQMLNQDLPYVFLWSLDVYSGISRQIRDIFIQPYYYFTHFKDWSMK